MKNTITEEKKWTILESEYLIKRPWLTARRDVAQLPDGRINHEYYVLEYPDWVNIIAITEDGDFVLERQYRHALGNTLQQSDDSQNDGALSRANRVMAEGFAKLL